MCIKIIKEIWEKLKERFIGTKTKETDVFEGENENIKEEIVEFMV